MSDICIIYKSTGQTHQGRFQWFTPHEIDRYTGSFKEAEEYAQLLAKEHYEAINGGLFTPIPGGAEFITSNGSGVRYFTMRLVSPRRPI